MSDESIKSDDEAQKQKIKSMAQTAQIINDSISKFYYSKNNSQNLNVDNFDVEALENFSSEEIVDDPEDITFENHRKHCHKHASNIHH